MYMPENIQEYILKSSESVHDTTSVMLTCFSQPAPMFNVLCDQLPVEGNS